MAMIVKEYVNGDLFYDVSSESPELSEGIEAKEAAEYSSPIDPNSIMVDVEAIHAYPYVTGNFTRYMPKCLKESIPSWTKPYRRPVIKHHNDENGEIIGRVCDARYKTKDTLSDTPCLEMTLNIPGKEKEDIKNGLLETTSIGAIVTDARCSICGHQLAGGNMCEHIRGEYYDGELCTWDFHKMKAKEISYVIVPSDAYSKNIAIYPATKSSQKSTNVTERLDQTLSKGEQKNNMPDIKDTIDSEKIASLEKSVADITAAKEKAEADLKLLVKEKEELLAKVADFEKLKGDYDMKAQESESLKDALETELADAKMETRESLIQTVQFMRKALGKSELSVEATESRSVESLKDSINDMKEDFKARESIQQQAQEIKLPEASSVSDPTLNNIEAKESEAPKKTSLNLKDELYNAIYGVSNYHHI